MNCYICNLPLPKNYKKYCSKECQIKGSLLENKCKKSVLETYTNKFNNRVFKTDGCWIWRGVINKGGYGTMHFLRKTEKAHRISYFLFRGEIPEGLWVLHKCDNPPCVNPNHLFLGTRTDNIRDMIKKGRHNFKKGETHRFAKLKEKEVIGVKLLLKQKIECSEIAKFFKVHQSTIYNIKYQKSWRHIKP